MSDSVWQHRQQPTRLPCPWDSPGKNTGEGCHSLLQCVKVKSESEVAKSCLTLSNPMDCSLPGSSVHGIFQAKVLEWGATAFSSTQTIVFKYHFILKEDNAAWRNRWFQGWANAVQNELEISCHIRKHKNKRHEGKKESSSDFPTRSASYSKLN